MYTTPSQRQKQAGKRTSILTPLRRSCATRQQAAKEAEELKPKRPRQSNDCTWWEADDKHSSVKFAKRDLVKSETELKVRFGHSRDPVCHEAITQALQRDAERFS